MKIDKSISPDFFYVAVSRTFYYIGVLGFSRFQSIEALHRGDISAVHDCYTPRMHEHVACGDISQRMRGLCIDLFGKSSMSLRKRNLMSLRVIRYSRSGVARSVAVFVLANV